VLYEIMNHIHNFFPVKGAAITGEITIGDWIFDTLNFDVGVTEDTKDLRYSTTAIRLPLQDGQYYLVSGSIFNDGVYQYHKGNTAPLQEETFNGVVVPLTGGRNQRVAGEKRQFRSVSVGIVWRIFVQQGNKQ
jgi:hypothetical protein